MANAARRTRVVLRNAVFSPCEQPPSRASDLSLPVARGGHRPPLYFVFAGPYRNAPLGFRSTMFEAVSLRLAPHLLALLALFALVAG